MVNAVIIIWFNALYGDAMTAPLPADLAKALEKHIIAQVKNRLVNWGAWWRRDNELEIRRSTGQRSKSPIAVLMERGRAQRSGYASDHLLPIDSDDALAFHRSIILLSGEEIGELVRFYADRRGSGDNRQAGIRYRAIRKLAGLALTIEHDEFPNELSKR